MAKPTLKRVPGYTITFELSEKDLSEGSIPSFFGMINGDNKDGEEVRGKLARGFNKLKRREDFEEKLSELIKLFVLDDDVEWSSDDYKFESVVWHVATEYCKEAGVETIYNDC